MLIVLDNVLSLENNQKVLDYIQQDGWVEGISPLQPLLDIASKYVDLSQMVGYEYWCNTNQQGLEWHTDKDENLFHSIGKLELPLCSIVYYTVVSELFNGKFITLTETITPKYNRLLIFNPGMIHKVEAYTGTRTAISINPWTRRLE
jgi:hypothetical protein